MSAFTVNGFYVVNIFRRILLSFHKQTHIYIYNRLYIYFELYLSLTYTAHIAAEQSSGKEMRGGNLQTIVCAKLFIWEYYWIK